MVERALLVSVLISGVALAPPLGGLPPASPDDIAAAVGDCWNVVASGAVDRARLDARGWKAGTPAARNGIPIVGAPSLFGKAGSNVIIVLSNTPKARAVCTVTAAVASQGEIGKAAGAVRRALTAVDPKVKTALSEGGIVFMSLPRIAMLEPTGTKKQPATRIAVAYQTASSE